MKTDKSCGAVLFTIKDGIRHYVLIQAKNRKNIAPPKGHIENAETETETALREIKEEAGVDAEIIDGFRKEINYVIQGGIKKQVVYFLAKYENQTAHCPPGEKGKVLLLPIEEALAATPYENVREVLRDADLFIRISENHVGNRAENRRL
ncbi:MAG: NUDIX domain-containing protein [Defluviitaleaceae bacterium]|nr:NUDIX domain-containing protein [Defluviitaleaceae bacterium]